MRQEECVFSKHSIVEYGDFTYYCKNCDVTWTSMEPTGLINNALLVKPGPNGTVLTTRGWEYLNSVGE